jgi:Ca2+-binding RTX toxin-like protein
MARFDLSLLRTSAEITPYVSSIPYVEVDQDSLTGTDRIWQGYGVIDIDGTIHETQFTYYGRFDYSSEQRFLNSAITGANLASPTYGSFSVREMNFRVSDFLDDPDIVSAKLLAGNDTIIGTNFADKLDGHKGNDTIYGGRGNDQIIGGTGTNQVWGQGGRDTFYVAKGAGHSVVRDFKKGEDKIAFLSGTSGLKLSSKGRDAYIYQNNDLMAIVNGASGQLNMNGTFLV